MGCQKDRNIERQTDRRTDRLTERQIQDRKTFQLSYHNKSCSECQWDVRKRRRRRRFIVSIYISYYNYSLNTEITENRKQELRQFCEEIEENITCCCATLLWITEVSRWLIQKPISWLSSWMSLGWFPVVVPVGGCWRGLHHGRQTLPLLLQYPVFLLWWCVGALGGLLSHHLHLVSTRRCSIEPSHSSSHKEQFPVLFM